MDQLERNKQLVRRAWAAFDACDEAAFAACVTDDWREHDAGGVMATIADANEAMRLHRVAFTDKRTTIERIVAEGDLVVTHSRTEATHTGEYLGVAPSGKRLFIEEMLINRIAGDRIAESWQVASGGFTAQITGVRSDTGARTTSP
jgi:predicted ester cyclase